MRNILSLLTICDIILAAVFVMAAGLIFTWSAAEAATGSSGGSVTLTRNGQAVGEYPLDEDATIDLEWQGHRNLLVIENGQAHMAEANCPDGYCLRQGPISRERQTIVCLPARLVVTVSGGEEGELDAISN